MVPLTKVFSMSLEQSVLPLDWKRANVTPIFKKGSKKDKGNYRHVSLTCHACRIMERILREEIVTFLEENNKITGSQHGFRNKKSCLTNLLEFMETTLNCLDDGDPVDVLFFDLQKAFDKVPHKRLLFKLHRLGIQGKILKWVEEWLSGRTQRVVMNGCVSEWEEVISGVPQGSVLGPILFLAYINDMEDKVLSSFWKFADDSKMLRKVNSENDTIGIKQDLHHLEEWSKKWQMPFNAKKCKVMHVGKKNPLVNYEIDGVVLERVEQEVNLGVLLRDVLGMEGQCSKAANKANQILGLISRTFVSRERKLILTLYKSLVRPHLDYSVQAWRPFLKKDIETLERVQRRATRMVEGLKNIPYEERLKRLNLTTLETRRLRADMIEVYKMFHGMEGLDRNKFF